MQVKQKCLPGSVFFFFWSYLNSLFNCYFQAYEGAVYDPNMAYTYASPDAIQQYVGGGLIPYQGGFPGYPHPGGYAVQSGYEGFLVPSFPGPAPIGPPPVPANFLAPGPGFFDLIREVMPFPRSIFNFVSSLGMWLLSGFGVVVAGGAMTTGICMFTPLCSISFALPFLALRDTAKKLGDVIEFDADTADRVRRAADFVQAALEKYNKLQETLPEDDAQTNAEADAN